MGSGTKRPEICPLLRQGYYVEIEKELLREDNMSSHILIVWFLNSYFKRGHWFFFKGCFIGWVGAVISVMWDSLAFAGRQVQCHCLGHLLATSLRKKNTLPHPPLTVQTPLKFINKP